MATLIDPRNPISPSYLLDVTEAIAPGGAKQILQGVGFHLHRVKVGQKPALVKVYEGLPPHSVPDEIKYRLVEVSYH